MTKTAVCRCNIDLSENVIADTEEFTGQIYGYLKN